MEAEGWMVLVHDPIGLDPVRKQRPKVKQRLKLKTDAEAETEGEAETEAEARTESSDFCICSSLQGRSREAKTEDEDRRLMKIGGHFFWGGTGDFQCRLCNNYMGGKLY
ncbi:hypothetical protein NC653_001443 [Populus alba x Populus x berolinensis]|uniref:Uncharacterized protein n=1 Tax=Populus alba x Populus x berolinensis TaxID=444605 RepID=A0AAD6RLG8_9ROSI|nr:hypothetical protein NC653_001443 [Populus alba x Populus x berolinensis]